MNLKIPRTIPCLYSYESENTWDRFLFIPFEILKNHSYESKNTLDNFLLIHFPNI